MLRRVARLAAVAAIAGGGGFAAFVPSIGGDGANVSYRSVTRVVDGDTLEVAGVGTVRVIGVDTPELSRCGGASAKRETARLVAGGVRLVDDVETRDRYGRRLAHVYTSNGRLLSTRLVAGGFGRAAVLAPNGADVRDRLARAEGKARTRSVGLWRSCGFRSAYGSTTWGSVR